MTRTLVIGLDGAAPTLIEKWADEGRLPHLAALMQRGVYGELRSVMPVLSSAAWVSMMTGMNPGKHGIYDFVQRDLTTLARHSVRGGAQLTVPTLWRLLSRAGQRVGVVNVPMTYPPEVVNGVMVSGLGTPDYRPFTYPPDLETELRGRGYRVNKRVHFDPAHAQAFWDEVAAITDVQAQAALDLLQREPWDFFMHVVRDSDEMAHFFWAAGDPTHPQHTPALAAAFGVALRDYYTQVDGWVGKLVEAAGADVDVLVVSDHGSGPLYKDVSLNEWLRQAGFLRLKPERAAETSPKQVLARLGLTRQRISRLLRHSGLGRVERWIKDRLGDKIQMLAESERRELSEIVDWSQTQAYSFGYHGQIYLNLAGREAQGIVQPDQADAAMDAICAALTELRDPTDGQPVVSALYRKEDLFHGPHVDWAPDITVIMRDLAYITRQGYEFAETPEGLFALPHTHETGSHREMGVIIAAGPSFAPLGRSHTPVSLMDIAPTVLQLRGCAVPAAMDGAPFSAWYSAARQDAIRAGDAHVLEADDAAPATAAEWSARDEEALLRQLRGLGYVE
jgi:predicted AlkP superfamily phosphohydrolase/phosphomutase